MVYELLASLVFYLHGVFAILVVPSVFLALFGCYEKLPTLHQLHNHGVAIMAAGQLTLHKCPMVAMEERLRTWAGTQMPYEGSYIRHVVYELTSYTLPSGSVMAASTCLVLLTVAAWVIHRHETVAVPFLAIRKP